MNISLLENLERSNQELHQEITGRLRTERELQENEGRLRALANAMPDLVFVLDEEGRYIKVLTAEKVFCTQV